MAALWQVAHIWLYAVAAAAAEACQHLLFHADQPGQSGLPHGEPDTNNSRCMQTTVTPVLVPKTGMQDSVARCCASAAEVLHPWGPVAAGTMTPGYQAEQPGQLPISNARQAPGCHVARGDAAQAHPLPSRVSHLLDLFDAVLVLLVCLVVRCRQVQECQVQGPPVLHRGEMID